MVVVMVVVVVVMVVVMVVWSLLGVPCPCHGLFLLVVRHQLLLLHGKGLLVDTWRVHVVWMAAMGLRYISLSVLLVWLQL